MKIDKEKIQNFVKIYKLQILLALGGMALILGAFVFQNKINLSGSKIEILKNNNQTSTPQTSSSSIKVDVSGSVQNPGVYKLENGSRVEDALIASGGLSANADRNWVDRNLNKAAKLVDGQKIYIPSQQSNVLGASATGTGSSVAQFSGGSELSGSSEAGSTVNINSATFQELDSLPGIGQVYAQNIIDHRPYSDINDLVTNKVLKQSVFDKIKNQISVY